MVRLLFFVNNIGNNIVAIQRFIEILNSSENMDSWFLDSHISS